MRHHSIIVQQRVGAEVIALAMAADIGRYAVLALDRAANQWRFVEKGLTQAEARWLFARRQRAAGLAAA